MTATGLIPAPETMLRSLLDGTTGGRDVTPHERSALEVCERRLNDLYGKLSGRELECIGEIWRRITGQDVRI